MLSLIQYFIKKTPKLKVKVMLLILFVYLVRQVPPFLQTLLLQAAAGVGPIVAPSSTEESVVTRVVVVVSPVILTLEVAPSSTEL